MNELASKAQSSFYFTSSPSSWVGHGETELITPENGSISLDPSGYDSGLHLAITTTSGEWWYLDFGTSSRGTLSDGMYADATRYPFNDGSSPGLSFIGQGRGDNTLTGWFDVLDVLYSGSTVTSAAIDFVQYDEGNESWENYGSIRYNSDIPIDFSPIPEPQSLVFAAIGGLSTLILKKKSVK